MKFAELGSATLKCSGATAACSKCSERYRYTHYLDYSAATMTKIIGNL